MSKIGVANPTLSLEALVDTDLDTLLTALYVKIDDEMEDRWLGHPPLLSDSELVCLAVAQALLGYHTEHRWLRYARKHLSDCSPTCRTSPATTSGCGPRCRWSSG